MENSKGDWDKLCTCKHWFHEHYDNGLNREGCSFGECLHKDILLGFCQCKYFDEDVQTQPKK